MKSVENNQSYYKIFSLSWTKIIIIYKTDNQKVLWFNQLIIIIIIVNLYWNQD